MCLCRDYLLIAFRDFLPENIWGPLTEVSNFFRALCATEIRRSDMESLEKSIVETICKLEKFFPPGFFDSNTNTIVSSIIKIYSNYFICQ
ncbi:hypothetical protein ACS0TY_025222 [Phlomoides rotata]